MSILFTSSDGCIISHIDYLNDIYKNVDLDGKIRKLKFKDDFFKINSQFLRQNQIKNVNEVEKDQRPPRKKMKKVQSLPENLQEQNNFVKIIGERILNSASELQILKKMAVDHNEEARLASKNFFLNEICLSHQFCGSNSRDLPVVAEYSNEKFVFPANSKFYSYDIRSIRQSFQIDDHFDLILLDPPWWNKSIRRKNVKFKEGSYKMLRNEEIEQIPIGQLLNPTGIVAVWCTNNITQMKSILEQIFPTWGVSMKGKWYWLKISQNCEPICDFGTNHGKQPYEQIIFATLSSNTQLNLPQDKVIVSVPSAVHSHKPPLSEILSPYLPEKPKCLEIFARYLLPNWTSCGLEVLKFQRLSLFTMMDQEQFEEN
ncbi:hypothetical protein QAD02_004093 [Eretmocerus hayati]|uniref:Uncharacterized protein n=1 Tax=Eretmocerus hayati TaxID=131215 RepID=A0ACC2NNT1_9HYME|nr:hypothetical protein QAD02_004093 [Eretmocerus hayati]